MARTYALVVIMLALSAFLAACGGPKLILEDERFFPYEAVTRTYDQVVFEDEVLVLRPSAIHSIPEEMIGSVGGIYWIPLTPELLGLLEVQAEVTPDAVWLTRGSYRAQLIANLPEMIVNGVTVPTEAAPRVRDSIVWVPLSTLRNGLALKTEVDYSGRRLLVTDVSQAEVAIAEAEIHDDRFKTRLGIDLNRPVIPSGRIEIDVPPNGRVDGSVVSYAGTSSWSVIAEIPLLSKGQYRGHINRAQTDMVDLTGAPLPHLDFVFEVR